MRWERQVTAPFQNRYLHPSLNIRSFKESSYYTMEKESGNNATIAGDLSSLEKGTGKISNDDIQEQQPKHAELPDLPEGGTKAYLAVVGAFAGMFVSFGWV
jgi:hypothetical protein